MNKKNSVSFDKELVKRLKNQKFATEYLNEALEEERYNQKLCIS